VLRQSVDLSDQRRCGDSRIKAGSPASRRLVAARPQNRPSSGGMLTTATIVILVR